MLIVEFFILNLRKILKLKQKMKNILLFALIFSGLLANSQTRVDFSYDGAGNQIKRQLCLFCRNQSSINDSLVLEDLKDENFHFFFEGDVISYYPNPVKEELFLKWELIDGKNVERIELYTLTGQLVKKYINLNVSNKLSIPFNNLPDGIYTILLLYSNGEQKDIKIIKE